jgi:HlyD family type I secretion membrane fusion protein
MNMLPNLNAGRGKSQDILDGTPESDSPSSGGVRRSLLIAGGLFAVLILLASFVPMGAAVLGGGQVGLESRVKRIAHPIGGVIAEIAVKNGQHVEKDQLLMRLDDRVSGADATYSGLTVEQLLAQQARLEAERLNSGRIIFPPELLRSSNASARKAMADESSLFFQRQREEGLLRSQLSTRVEQHQQEIVGAEAQIASLRRQLSLIEPERVAVRELWDKQLVTINRLNQLERTVAELEGNIAALNARIAETRAKITEAQEQSIQLVESRRVKAGTDLSQVNTVLNQQQLRSVAASDQHDRSDIRAPYSGTVEKIAFSAIGDVIRPAEAIMEILPDEDLMIVEVMVDPADIDQVKVGQTAQARFTSYNRGTTPEILGRVTYVATDRSDNPETKTSFFMVRIALDQAALKRENMALRSGMPADVHIETGSRSLLSYFFKPLRDQLARAFNDN